MGSPPAKSTKDLIDKAKLTWGKPPLGIHTWGGPWADFILEAINYYYYLGGLPPGHAIGLSGSRPSSGRG